MGKASGFLLLVTLLSVLLSGCGIIRYDPPNYTNCQGSIGIVQGK